MAQIHSLLSSFAALNLGKQDLHFRIRNFKARSVSVHSHYKHTIKFMCRSNMKTRFLLFSGDVKNFLAKVEQGGLQIETEG